MVRISTGYYIYKYIEFIIFSLYLIFVFLSVQIWLLWKDVDKNELKIKTIFSESFFKKNCIYVFSLFTFFIVHEFFNGINLPDAMVYFEFFEMMALISLVLFAYGWYNVLKTCVQKKSLPKELMKFTKH